MASWNKVLLSNEVTADDLNPSGDGFLKKIGDTIAWQGTAEGGETTFSRLGVNVLNYTDSSNSAFATQVSIEKIEAYDWTYTDTVDNSYTTSIVRLKKTSHGLSPGDLISIFGVDASYGLNNSWVVETLDDDQVSQSNYFFLKPYSSIYGDDLQTTLSLVAWPLDSTETPQPLADITYNTTEKYVTGEWLFSSDDISLIGTSNRVILSEDSNLSGASKQIRLDLPQDIGKASDVEFGSIIFPTGGQLTLGKNATVGERTFLKQTGANALKISSGSSDTGTVTISNDLTITSDLSINGDLITNPNLDGTIATSYNIASVDTLNATTLGANVINSSLRTLGTINHELKVSENIKPYSTDRPGNNLDTTFTRIGIDFWNGYTTGTQAQHVYLTGPMRYVDDDNSLLALDDYRIILPAISPSIGDILKVTAGGAGVGDTDGWKTNWETPPGQNNEYSFKTISVGTAIDVSNIDLSGTSNFLAANTTDTLNFYAGNGILLYTEDSTNSVLIASPTELNTSSYGSGWGSITDKAPTLKAVYDKIESIGGSGGIALSDLSTTTTAVGTASLTYNSGSGGFTYTPPDLSSYLTAETSHNDVLVDGDFVTSGFMKTDGSGSYSIDSSTYITTCDGGDSGNYGISNIVSDTTPELGGELDCGANSIGFTKQTATGVVGTTTINWKLGNKFEFTFGAGDETFVFTSPSNPCNIMLMVKQDNNGSRILTYPSNVKWPSNTEPTLSTGANAIDILSFYFDGTDFYGMASLDFS